MLHFYGRFLYPFPQHEQWLYKKFHSPFLPQEGKELIDGEAAEIFVVEDIKYVHEEGASEILVIVDLIPSDRSPQEWSDALEWTKEKGWSDEPPFITENPGNLSA